MMHSKEDPKSPDPKSSANAHSTPAAPGPAAAPIGTGKRESTDKKMPSEKNLKIPEQKTPPIGKAKQRKSSFSTASSKELTAPAPTGVSGSQGTRPGAKEKVKKSKAEESHSGEEGCIHIRNGIDVTWLNKGFQKMSPQERKFYDMLDALKDCSNDRFLCVRGLLEAEGEKGGTDGTIDAQSLLRALDKLHIKHDFEESDIHVFFKILQPDSDTDNIEGAELEKSVNRLIHKAMKGDAGKLNDGLAGLHALGEQARRLDDEDVWHHRHEPGSDEDLPVTIFGWVAFMESLLRISLSHLHKSGIGIQSASPGGVRFMWLVTFLGYRFDKMLEAKRAATAAKSPRPSPRGPPDISQREMSGDLRMHRPVSQAVHTGGKGRVEAWHSRPHGTGASLGVAVTGKSKEQRHATYDTFLRLLDSRPDIFKPWLDCKDQEVPTHRRIDTSRAGEECTACGRCRNSRGMGHLFCHVCSGVDDQPLEDLHLYPVLQRKRLHLNIQAMEEEQKERELLEQEQKEREQEELMLELEASDAVPALKGPGRNTSKNSKVLPTSPPTDKKSRSKDHVAVTA
jgi:hypothetical protein